MEKLPLELLQQVLQYLPRADLPSVRLLTRTLAAAAEPLLFHTIPLWIELQSVEALTGISEHPRLSQYVKEIVFSPLRFIEHEDRSLYQAELRNDLEHESGSLSSRTLYLGHLLATYELRLEHHMAAYDHFEAGQCHLAANSLDVKLLSYAFGKLPHLRTLVVDHLSNIAAIRLYNAFGGYGSMPYVVTCSGEYGLPVLFKALANSRVAISTFRIGPSHALDPTWSDSTWSDPDEMRRVLFKSPRPFPVLNAEETICQALRKTFRSSNKNTYGETLRDLRVLEVSETRLENLGDGTIIDKYIDAIGTIISWGSHIESIAVPQFGIYDFDADDKSLMMSKLFQTEHLKKLKKLKLESFDTTLSYFKRFFRRYGKQLQEIKFDGVNIDDAEWSTALYHLRAIKFPELVTFEVDCVDVCDYIKGVTNINPIEEDYVGFRPYVIMPSTYENHD